MAISKAQIRLVKSLQQKKFRDETGYFVAEGKKAVEDLRTAFEMVMYFTQQQASEKEIEQMSGLRTPQGVIAVFRKREDILPLPQAICAENQLLLMLDGVQDPGNLGTIIRTADWFGIRHIVCSHETADCYNPKVVQATMGALARVQVHYTVLTDWLAKVPAEVPIYGTLLDGKNIYAEPLQSRGIVIMGNEGNGISSAVRAFINTPLLIPSYPTDVPTSESLNVAIATAITLAEFRRR